MVPLRASVAGVTVALALAACSGGGAAPSSSPAPSVVPSFRPADVPMCLPHGSSAFTAGPEDDPTLVGVAGTGTRGVVLAPQSDGQVCQWSRQLARLVDQGYRVATFSWSADGERSFTDAVDVLRIEAGLGLSGHEFDDATDPFEAGIGFTVDLDGAVAFLVALAIYRGRRLWPAAVELSDEPG